MSDFVLVRQDNGHIGPVSRAFAEKRGLGIVDGDAVDVRTGRLKKVTRGNGRPVKPKASVAKKAAAPRRAPAKKSAAAKKTAAKKAAPNKAVTPTEGAADTTLTNTKE